MSTAGVSSAGSQTDLRQQLSGSIANTLIRTPPRNEEADPEQQPLRQNTPVANRERFQQNQRTAAQGVVQRSGWVILIIMTLLSMLLFVWVAYYVQGWSIWRAHGEKPCDQPLAKWLLGILILPLVALVVELGQWTKLRVLVIVVTLFVLLIGLRMFYKSETCDSTNPELHKFVRAYLIFLTIWWISWVVMPLAFVAVVIYGMWHGWFDELNGASPDTIKQVETVTYDPELFDPDRKSDDSGPTPECCICTETFGTTGVIKRTACQHYFHEECLGKWLRVSTTCPLCRNDLERATLGETSSGAQPSSSSGARSNFLNYGTMAEGPVSEFEAQEADALMRMFPGFDESTALMAVRNSGSAEAAAAIFNEP